MVQASGLRRSMASNVRENGANCTLQWMLTGVRSSLKCCPIRTAATSARSQICLNGFVTLSFFGRKCQRLVDLQATPAAIFHASKASRRWYRIVCAARRRDGTEKQLRVAECMETNRCNMPGDRWPCMVRSRFRNGRWLFSARLLRPLCDQCSRSGTTSAFAARLSCRLCKISSRTVPF